MKTKIGFLISMVICILITNTAFAEDTFVLQDDFESSFYTVGGKVSAGAQSVGWNTGGVVESNATRGIDILLEASGNRAANFWNNKASTEPYMKKDIIADAVYSIDFSVKTKGFDAYIDVAANTSIMFKISGNTINLYDAANAAVPVAGYTNNPNVFEQYTLIVDTRAAVWMTKLYRDGAYIGAGLVKEHSGAAIGFKAKFSSSQTASLLYDNISIVRIDGSEYSMNVDKPNAADIDLFNVNLSVSPDRTLTDADFLLTDLSGNSLPIERVTKISSKKYAIKPAGVLEFDKAYQIGVSDAVTDVLSRKCTAPASFKTRTRIFYISDLILSANGSQITALTSGEISAKVSATNYLTEPQDILVMQALYDSDNSLVNVTYNKATVQPYESLDIAAVMNIGSTTGKTLKVFIWDNMESQNSRVFVKTFN